MARKARVLDPVELRQQFAEALRRTSARPTIIGYEAQPHQVEFHMSRNTGRLFIGGNRSGKTVGGGADMVMNMTGKHLFEPLFTPPIRCRAVGVDFDNGVDRIILPEIARWVPPSFLINGSWEDSYVRGTHTLTLKNGSVCEFMSYDQDVEKFAGTSRHLIWFDEEPPRAIYDECMMRLVDVGGRWMCTMTPIEEMTWTYDGLYLPAKEKTNPHIDVFEVETYENKYVNRAEVEILTQGLSKEDKEARTKGRYIRHTGAIYGEYIDPEINLLKHDPVYSKAWDGMLKNWRHFRMMDHGFRNPTCFLFGCIDTEGKVIIYDEYYASGKLVKENAEAVLRQTEDLGIGNSLYYTVGDPSIQNTDPITGTSVLAEYAQHGLGIVLGNNDVHFGILRVASRFQQRMLYIGPRCHKLKWELNRYRWDKYLNKKVAERANYKEQPLKKDDHACDALRYGIVSTPPLVNEVDDPVGNVLNVNTPIMGERYASIVTSAPPYQDIHLGDDY